MPPPGHRLPRARRLAPRKLLPPGKAGRHSVRLSDGTVLNRYWDTRDAPRDESFKEDAKTAADSGRPPALVYRNLRAATESGWDFSSRWLTDGKTLGTGRTLSILPVDINGLLVHLEQTLSDAYRAQGDAAQAAAFQARALTRSVAIQRLRWDPRDGVFEAVWPAAVKRLAGRTERGNFSSETREQTPRQIRL